MSNHLDLSLAYSLYVMKGIQCQLFTLQVIHCMGRMKRYSAGGLPGPKYAFVAIGQPLPTMNINELPLECNMFVSRVNMDLKIVYCEGRCEQALFPV